MDTQDLLEEGCELYIDLLGKNFKPTGRGPDVYDCYGLAIEVCKRQGIVLPDIYSEVEAELIHLQIVENTTTTSTFNRLEKPEPFCLVTFTIHPPYVSHIGVVLADCKRFIHILARRKVTIERLDSPDWVRRVVGYYAINQS